MQRHAFSSSTACSTYPLLPIYFYSRSRVRLYLVDGLLAAGAPRVTELDPGANSEVHLALALPLGASIRQNCSSGGLLPMCTWAKAAPKVPQIWTSGDSRD